jgi:sulfatase maturation enzyme AslB (radical SAM superfamily)
LEEDIFLRLIDDASKAGVKGIQFAGCGEPLMNKSLPKAIIQAHQKNISVALTTNGVLYGKDLVEKTLGGITWVRYSILGGSPKTYAQLHQVDQRQFNILLKNIEDAGDLRKKHAFSATLGIAMYLFRENAHEIVAFAKRMRDIGMDYFVVKCPGYDSRNTYKPERGLEEVYADELKEVEKLNNNKFKAVVRWDQFAGETKGVELPAGCLSVDFMATIDADGRVYCCNGHWRNDQYCYGDLHENSFIEIWNSQRRKSIAKRVKERADHKACYCVCRNCSANRFLWELTHPPEHVNLI